MRPFWQVICRSCDNEGNYGDYLYNSLIDRFRRFAYHEMQKLKSKLRIAAWADLFGLWK